MKNIEYFKDEVAKYYGFHSFMDVFNYECNNDYEISKMVSEICQKYAEYIIDQCAESAELIMQLNSGVDDWFLDKNSILKLKNEIR